MAQNRPGFQTLEAKRAESQRGFSGENVLKDSNLSSMLRERADTMLKDLRVLEEKKVPFSPFLEIGAGSVQRSTALINHYSADGVATDISQQSLRDTPFTLSLLGYSRAPSLICCDAHYIPFLSNTFQFVFAYQTLHHFENPIPVVAECYRVLAKGGCFYFNEEPMDSPLRRFLRGNRMLSHPPTRWQQMAYRAHIEKVFWDDGMLERSLGMTEARFDIGLWRETLKPFREISVEVNRRLRINTNLYAPALGVFLAGIAGGNVKGLCVKTDGDSVVDDFHKRLMCLDCRSTLLLCEEHLHCQYCGRVYPVYDGVIRMLPKELETHLFGM